VAWRRKRSDRFDADRFPVYAITNYSISNLKTRFKVMREQAMGRTESFSTWRRRCA
jgi:hypothetical protein